MLIIVRPCGEQFLGVKMADEEKGQKVCCPDGSKNNWRCGGGDGVYFFGLIGAAIYFIGKATTFWVGVLGFLKALVWPAYAVYHLLKFLLG